MIYTASFSTGCWWCCGSGSSLIAMQSSLPAIGFHFLQIIGLFLLCYRQLPVKTTRTTPKQIASISFYFICFELTTPDGVPVLVKIYSRWKRRKREDDSYFSATLSKCDRQISTTQTQEVQRLQQMNIV